MVLPWLACLAVVVCLVHLGLKLLLRLFQLLLLKQGGSVVFECVEEGVEALLGGLLGRIARFLQLLARVLGGLGLYLRSIFSESIGAPSG